MELLKNKTDKTAKDVLEAFDIHADPTNKVSSGLFTCGFDISHTLFSHHSYRVSLNRQGR